MNNFPCPCCGYLVFTGPPGSYDICPICFWEDDLSQLRFVRTDGANRVSLTQAQRGFANDGVSESKFKKHVRKPGKDDSRDPKWRPIDESLDNIEDSVRGTNYGLTYPTDSTSLYYWRPNYWRRSTN
ncbi:MAG: CPCC family cysteine-rich protein [Candidatus Acidiferrum sp.]